MRSRRAAASRMDGRLKRIFMGRERLRLVHQRQSASRAAAPSSDRDCGGKGRDCPSSEPALRRQFADHGRNASRRHKTRRASRSKNRLPPAKAWAARFGQRGRRAIASAPGSPRADQRTDPSGNPDISSPSEASFLEPQATTIAAIPRWRCQGRERCMAIGCNGQSSTPESPRDE